MAEILIKASDYTHDDPEKDRRGVHKIGDIINIKPDGWSSHPNWITSSYPYSKTGSFVLIKVPTITEAEVLHLRDPWADEFVYEIIDEVPEDGIVNLKLFEKNIGAESRANGIVDDKAGRIKEALSKWNCLEIVQGKEDIIFTFRLFDAVKSEKFWSTTPEKIAEMTFTLSAYDAKSGVATITANIPDERLSEEASLEVAEKLQGATSGQLAKYDVDETARTVANITSTVTAKGATLVSADTATKDYTISAKHDEVLARFKSDVQRLQQTYTRHRHCIDSATMALAITNGGILTMTAQDFINSLQDKMI